MAKGLIGVVNNNPRGYNTCVKLALNLQATCV